MFVCFDYFTSSAVCPVPNVDENGCLNGGCLLYTSVGLCQSVTNIQSL